MMKYKDYLSLIFVFLFVIMFGIWNYNYNKNTERMVQQLDNIQTQVNDINEDIDILRVPEKSIDYWEGKNFEINWYMEKQNGKSKIGSKSNSKSNDNNNSFVHSIQSSSIFHKVDSYNISLDIISNYIKEKEGFRPKAYRDGCLVKAKKCPHNKIRYSNGYGTLAESSSEVVSIKIAEQRLYKHIEKTIYPKLKNVKFKNIQQIYASIDFAYNIGHNAFANNIVNEKGEVDCVKMTEYTIFNGKENEGLKKRRFENFMQCVSM